MRPARVKVLTVLAATVVVLAGCTSAPAAAPDPAGSGATVDPDPTRFDLEGEVAVSCMSHQTSTPGVDYTDPARETVFRNLPVLKYYASNGSKGYCDGAGPNNNDRAWAQWSADQSSNRAPVAAILDAPTA